MKVLVPLTFFAFLAVSHSASINYEDAISERLLIDPIIKAILEGMRPKLANLTIPDINQTIADPNLNATIVAKNIGVQNADKFVIRNLKSNVLFLKLTNLTLFWNEITAKAYYDVNATVKIPQIPDSVNLFGKGNSRATFYGLFFTLGANLELKNNSLQIKPRGLFGFDVKINKANITVGSLLGSEELGKIASTFLSNIIPGLVDDIKKPLFDAMQDDIINAINQVLRNKGNNTLMDEQDEMSSDDVKGLNQDLLNLEDELQVLGESLESDENPFDL